MAKAQGHPRVKHLSTTIIWRIILAGCLCLCALTALYYEVSLPMSATLALAQHLWMHCSFLRCIALPQASAVVLGKGAIQAQLMADEDFTLRTHMLKPSAVLHIPCDYGVAEEDRHSFCCSGMAMCCGLAAHTE